MKTKQEEPALDPAQVLRVKEWIKLVGLCPDLAWRMLRSGQGPRLLKLSERRYGIKVADHLEWLERCAKAAKEAGPAQWTQAARYS